MKNKFLIGVLSVIGAQLIWATIEISGTFVYQGGATPLTLLSVRYFIASILLFLTILIISKDRLKVEIKDIKIFCIQGLILLIHLLAFWQGLKIVKHIPTTIGVYYTFPVWIVIFSALFWREKFCKAKVFSLILGLIGSLLIVGFLPHFDVLKLNIGTGLMLMAAISWAGYTMIGKFLFKKYHFSTILFYNFLFVFLSTILLQNPSITISQTTTTTLPNFLYLGIICTYVVFLLFYNGMKNLKISTVGIISYIKPIMGIILAFLILHQVTNTFQTIGIIMILFGNYLIYKKEWKN